MIGQVVRGINKYENGKLYKIVVGDDTYVGGTCQKLNQRKARHNWNLAHGLDFKIYKKARERNIDKLELELLENFACRSKRDLNRQEEVWRSLLNATLNERKCYLPDGYVRPRNYRDEYIKRKDKALEKIICEHCHAHIGRTNMNRHLKTDKCSKNNILLKK